MSRLQASTFSHNRAHRNGLVPPYARTGFAQWANPIAGRFREQVRRRGASGLVAGCACAAVMTLDADLAELEREIERERGLADDKAKDRTEIGR